jgi:hypothetical protein
LLYGQPKPNVFLKVLRNDINPSQEEPLADKLMKAYARMKLKAEKRNVKRRTGKTQWQPKLKELVLVKCQPVSDAVQGITGKFQRPY